MMIKRLLHLNFVLQIFVSVMATLTFNPFHATVIFWYPLKMFSGGIKRDQWHEMG